MKVRFAGCLKLICIVVVGLGAPLSRLLEAPPYIFLNELMKVSNQSAALVVVVVVY